MRSFFYNLDKTMSDARINRNNELYKLCDDVKQYVLEGSFTNYKKAKMLLSYWGEPDSFVTSMTGMKEGTVRVTRRNLSNELYELFGYDFFNAIAIGDKKAISEGVYRLGLVKKDISSDKFLYREFINDIFRGSEYNDDIDIKSCAMEIQFLLKHSKSSIEKELELLDKDKLAYLIRMLNNESGSISNIHKLVRCFEK